MNKYLFNLGVENLWRLLGKLKGTSKNDNRYFIKDFYYYQDYKVENCDVDHIFFRCKYFMAHVVSALKCTIAYSLKSDARY